MEAKNPTLIKDSICYNNNMAVAKTLEELTEQIREETILNQKQSETAAGLYRGLTTSKIADRFNHKDEETTKNKIKRIKEKQGKAQNTVKAVEEGGYTREKLLEDTFIAKWTIDLLLADENNSYIFDKTSSDLEEGELNNNRSELSEELGVSKDDISEKMKAIVKKYEQSKEFLDLYEEIF